MKALTLTAILVAATVPAFASDDHLFDPAFGSSGQRTVPFDLISGGQDRAVKVLRRPDGSYLVVGTASSGSGPHVAIARLTAAGGLDPTFGSGGKLTVDACMSDVTDAALDANGRILVLGNTTACGTAGSPDGRLMRLLTDGSIDTLFGAVGFRNITFTTVTAAHERANALVIRADGEILVGGGYDNDGPATVHVERPAVRRLTPDGNNMDVLLSVSSSVDMTVVDGVALADGGAAWLILRGANLAGGSGAFWKMTPTLANDTSFATLGVKTIQSGGPETGCGTSVFHRPTTLVAMQGTFKAFGSAVVGPMEVLQSWYASVNNDVGGTGLRVRCLTDVLPGEVSVYDAAHHPTAGPHDITLAGLCANPTGQPFQQCVLRVRHVNPAVPELLELDPTFNAGLPRVIQYAAATGHDPAGGGLSVLREASGRTVVAGWRRWNSGGDDDFAISRLGRDPLLSNGFEAP
jgi:uncharacterized delta-60 repeat protein